MENLSAETLWAELHESIPGSMDFVPNASVQMGQLQKQNQMLKLLLIGLGVISVGAVIYVLYKSHQDEKRKTS